MRPRYSGLVSMFQEKEVEIVGGCYGILSSLVAGGEVHRVVTAEIKGVKMLLSALAEAYLNAKIIGTFVRYARKVNTRGNAH